MNNQHIRETASEQELEGYDKHRRLQEQEERARESAKPFLKRESWRKRHMYQGWMLEPIIETVGERAAITRSNYGYRVLNTLDLGIVDVDFGLDCDGRFVGPQQKEALSNLRQWVGEHPGQSWNAYRTAAGLRLIRTDAPQLCDDSYDAVCCAIDGSDDLYRKLCHEQQAFRARVSPKPARCGIEYPYWNPYDAAGGGWAYSDPNSTIVPLTIKAYEILAAQYKVCELVEIVGPGFVHPDIYSTVTLHDFLCGTFTMLPLEPLHYDETHGPSGVDLVAFNMKYRPQGMAPNKIWAVLQHDTRIALRHLDDSDERLRVIEGYERLERLAQKWPVQAPTEFYSAPAVNGSEDTWDCSGIDDPFFAELRRRTASSE
jgi:hypothetical protein